MILFNFVEQKNTKQSWEKRFSFSFWWLWYYVLSGYPGT